jgi:hypothetical protein
MSTFKSKVYWSALDLTDSIGLVQFLRRLQPLRIAADLGEKMGRDFQTERMPTHKRIVR